jgi:TolA-binding protein
MEKSNVIKMKPRKEWQTPHVEAPKPAVNLVSVDMATLLYNLVQSQRQMLERVEEMSDMIEHMEYQIDQLRKERSLSNRLKE